MIGFGLVVLVQPGWSSPGGQWLILLATVVATAFLMGVIAEQSDLLAASEHDARAELAVVNRGLEDRVQEQVAEIEGLGRLRRFLSPQVADAVVSGGSEALSRPHRQRIAFTPRCGPAATIAAVAPAGVTTVLKKESAGAHRRSVSGDQANTKTPNPIPDAMR